MVKGPKENFQSSSILIEVEVFIFKITAPDIQSTSKKPEGSLPLAKLLFNFGYFSSRLSIGYSIQDNKKNQDLQGIATLFFL